MIGSRKESKFKEVQYQKLGRFIAALGSYRSETQKTVILAKNGQILVLNCQNFTISEFSRHKEYNFLKENHKKNFHTKNQENSQRRLEVIGQKLSKLSILAKNGPILDLNAQNFTISEFSRHIEYDFLKGTIKTASIPKIRKIHSGVWKLQVKNSQNCQFQPKRGFLGTKTPWGVKKFF